MRRNEGRIEIGRPDEVSVVRCSEARPLGFDHLSVQVRVRVAGFEIGVEVKAPELAQELLAAEEWRRGG